MTTLGKHGVEIAERGEETVRIPVVPEITKVDPTGVGDGFRAGFLAGRSCGLDNVRAAQLGSLVAVFVLETVGTQEYLLDWREAGPRLADAYGATAADEIMSALGVTATAADSAARSRLRKQLR